MSSFYNLFKTSKTYLYLQFAAVSSWNERMKVVAVKHQQFLFLFTQVMINGADYWIIELVFTLFLAKYYVMSLTVNFWVGFNVNGTLNATAVKKIIDL